MSANSWGECVLNNIEFGADGQRVGGETTNLLSESNAFLIAENDKLIITETLTASSGWGSVYDKSYNGKTLLER